MLKLLKVDSNWDFGIPRWVVVCSSFLNNLWVRGVETSIGVRRLVTSAPHAREPVQPILHEKHRGKDLGWVKVNDIQNLFQKPHFAALR